jgi:hypothetical protein
LPKKYDYFILLYKPLKRHPPALLESSRKPVFQIGFRLAEKGGVMYYEDKEIISCDTFTMLNLADNPALLKKLKELAEKRSFLKEHKKLMEWAKSKMPPEMLFEKQEEAIEKLFEAASFWFVIANLLNHKLEKALFPEADFQKEKQPSHLKLVKR